ncbi:MAG: energy coupling factor transporter S component ThiW [Megasphaera sp.]|jgi:energy coupling factor transporter S component ThiW|nr:energy coupling factor transporter S component ThiW [Megasphaera sp.]MCI1248133.1 energy coupling factor transporter S component ThiW [Megasphaera sp.]
MNNDSANLKKMTVTASFIAIGVLLAPFVSFPFGGARVFPLQHMINVLLSVLVGWQYSVAGAFCISSIRIAMGAGTILAYPGSLIGACLSGIVYKKTGSIWGAVAGEVFGTGILGGLIAYPVAAFVLDSQVVALYFFVIAFLPNTMIGAALGALVYKILPLQKLQQIMAGKQ